MDKDVYNEFKEKEKVVLDVLKGLQANENNMPKDNDNLQDIRTHLIQMAKMSAMGQLGAGVVHELNQSLSGIRGFAQLMLSELSDNDQHKDFLKKIIEQTDRMDTTIRTLRAYTRPSVCSFGSVDVNQCIDSALVLLETQLKNHNINLVKDYSHQKPCVYGDFNQLQQVFVNIISNARDALDQKTEMPKEIRIKTAYIKDDAGKGNVVEITIEDTGIGIAKELQYDIFNPFFTTKQDDISTGFGLSVVFNIIEYHSGQLSFESEEGMGSKFSIVLPLEGMNIVE